MRSVLQEQRLAPALALNDQQREAVTHGDAPLLVLAGAGTGKTMTLAARVAQRVLDGADPQRLLLLTFSRRAAAEMTRRAGRLLREARGLPPDSGDPLLPWAGTIHAIGARLLREQAAALGLHPHFTVLDRGDAESLMGWVREGLGLASRRERFPLAATCLAIHSRAVNAEVPLADLLAEHYPWCARWQAELQRLFVAYAAEKRRQASLDFDDLLLGWAEMMAVPALAQRLRERFDHVLVDEYQDTNALQARILRGLKPDGRGLTVVGDDAQSIYSFRAAEVRNILDFPAQFGEATRVVTLTRNYRSTQPVLDAANEIIALAAEGHRKRLVSTLAGGARPQLVSVDDEAAQAQWVADQVLAHREGGLKLKAQAVLMRASDHSAALELELTRRNIPFVKYGGLKFLEASHVKDVLAVLRWAGNPAGRVAGFRVAQLVPGLGPAHARRLLDAIEQSPDPQAALDTFTPPRAAAADWADLRALLRWLHTQPREAWAEELPAVLSWYRPHLHRLHEVDAAVREADLTQLARLATQHGTRERFLTELTLDPPAATSDESSPPLIDEDYLILSTIHAAKGQEWSAVFVLNVVDGCLPADLATGSRHQTEEERRLLYVAATRAKRHLHLMVPQRFHVTQQAKWGDRHVWGGLTRFIPPALAERCFERVAPRAGALDAVTAAGVPVADLGARLLDRWGTGDDD